MSRCVGCGAVLQSQDILEIGYIKQEKKNNALYCEKCFKAINYGQFDREVKAITDTDIIKDINKTNYPVICLIDVLNISKENFKFLDYIKNRKYILISKFDLLPKGVKEGKIIKYFKNNFYKDSKVMCISSKQNYNIEKVFKLLKDHNEEKVYVIGLTNAGKSTFLNSLMTINNIKPEITTSPIPNTTYDYLNITVNGIEFIDTPGFNNKNIYESLSTEMILRIKPKKELKVKTFQIKSGYSIIVENLFRIDYEGHLNSLNFYMNNNLNYKKVKTLNNNELITLSFKTFEIKEKKDIVINGLGFVKINKPGLIKVYSLSDDILSIRDKMI